MGNCFPPQRCDGECAWRIHRWNSGNRRVPSAVRFTSVAWPRTSHGSRAAQRAWLARERCARRRISCGGCRRARAGEHLAGGAVVRCGGIRAVGRTAADRGEVDHRGSTGPARGHLASRRDPGFPHDSLVWNRTVHANRESEADAQAVVGSNRQ